MQETEILELLTYPKAGETASEIHLQRVRGLRSPARLRVALLQRRPAWDLE